MKHGGTFTEQSRDRTNLLRKHHSIFGERLHSQDRPNRRKTREEMILTINKTGQSCDKGSHRIWRLCEVWRNRPQWRQLSMTGAAKRSEWCFTPIQKTPCCRHLWHRWNIYVRIEAAIKTDQVNSFYGGPWISRENQKNRSSIESFLGLTRRLSEHSS